MRINGKYGYVELRNLMCLINLLTAAHSPYNKKSKKEQAYKY